MPEMYECMVDSIGRDIIDLCAPVLITNLLVGCSYTVKKLEDLNLIVFVS